MQNLRAELLPSGARSPGRHAHFERQCPPAAGGGSVSPRVGPRPCLEPTFWECGAGAIPAN